MSGARGKRAAWIALVLLSGCAGLPPKPPAAQLPREVPLSPPPESSIGGHWPMTRWWTRYADSTLDALIDQALRDAPSIATAHARYLNARQAVSVASAASGAQVQANADVSRQRLSSNGLFSPSLLGFDWYNQHDLGLSVSYTFDWWGKQRATVEASLDEAHAAQAERSAAALLLASSIADTYFAWQADQARIELARAREQTIGREREIAAARVEAGVAPPDELDRTEQSLASAREQLAELEGSAALRVVALAGLLGCSTAELPPLHARSLPAIDAALPDDVRIDLIARRADITASRWRVEAAEEDRRSARADFFPNVSINALIGVQSIDAGKLLEYSSRVPGAGAALHLPIFDAGRLKARYGASDAAVNAAVASYRDTLVAAAREVANEATTLNRLAAERAQHLRALEAAAALKASAAARVAQGVVDPRTELSATESWLGERDALVELDAAVLAANIGLTQALGGGFERSAQP
ncbi:MAG TPA: efflux transporter outer membrane subunit [Steroidobacteraceae bacterium]|nr:efflux transporter outer membrane subunit [Steroidobacteraceae bacterium]